VIIFPGDEDFAEEDLAELKRLAETAGAEVVGQTYQRRNAPDKTYFIGKGKAHEVGLDAVQTGARLMIMNNDLSPAQGRNLERLTGLRVVERSQLIMDIFAAGARTLQARRQVELAQLQYSMPRLKRLWTHLSRIRSGIGMRGPGEQQLEVDRRIARRKIGELKRELKGFENRKRLEIESRKNFFKVCLVGYTNSGKSTLINKVTDADVLEEDRLFSTLDTRTRLWNLEGNLSVLLSDTVGFIRKLPHHLVASFHATLEEAATADLLLHVVDGSHPAALHHIEAVDSVLKELKSDKIPSILVLNKKDLVHDFMELSVLQRRFPRHVVTSAKNGEGLTDLADTVGEALLATYAEVEVEMPAASGKLQAFLAGVGDVIVSRQQNGRFYTTVRVPPFMLGRLQELVSDQDADLKIRQS
jgi:GTP-binding protein HflX